jgi:branched-subunit amino acid aminotransferase/4-amino-4-deoxychorismate lyase
MDRIEVNGVAAAIEDLGVLVTTNYGHFTSMQVVDGAARGLDLHLARLERSTRELFGCGLDIAATRAWMRQIAGRRDGTTTLRVNVFARGLDRDRLDRPARPDVLMSVAAARLPVTTPLRVKSVVYGREQPHIKHVGTFGLFDQRRRAQQAGFDDALFVDTHGVVAEGSIWNVGFFDASGVVWPDAPALRGVAMQLLEAGLREGGVAASMRRITLSEVAGFHGAFFCNSGSSVRPIAAIDDVTFAIEPARFAVLERACASQPWQPL